jgi:lipopolysaccharide export system protein LptA
MVLTAFSADGSGVFTATASSASGAEMPDGEMVIYLSGNVEVTDGEIFVTSDSGAVWQTTGRAIFIGSVTVVADTLTATGDRLEYDRGAGTAVLTGNAVLLDSENRLRASEVTWFRSAGKAVARDSVVMTGPWLGSVTGDYAVYDSARRSLFVTASPVLRRVEGADSITITADRLEFLPDSDMAEAQGNALLVSSGSGITAMAELLRYSGQDEMLEMLGSPRLTTADGELSGNWMEALLEQGQITWLRVGGAASGHLVDTEVSPPGESWFTSESAYFSFSGGSPDSVDLLGAVDLTIRSGGEAAARQESNAVTGDHLIVHYADGSPETVTVVGNVRGTYSYRREDT